MSEPTKTKKIEDAGEFIAGARKDWHLNAMNQEDVAKMTDEEIVTLVKKDNIWPKPDFEKLVEDGMEPLAAALVKVMRDKMAQQPRAWRGVDLIEGRKAFVHLIGVVRDMANACKTPSDVQQIYKLYDIYAKENNIGNDKWVIYKTTKTPLYLMSADLRKAGDMIKAGFPAKENEWKRNLKVIAWGNSFTLIRSKTILKNNFESEQAAWEWAKENATKRTTAKKDQKVEPKRPHLDKLDRHGLTYQRKETDITPEDFLEAFGFRGIQFGNWLPNGERQQVLNLGYEALMDLSEILGWEPKALSLDGTLGLAFGARGGGRFAAHYEAGQRVINMTKLSGAGSLAHEFAHALDHWMGTGTPSTNVPGGIPSATGWNIPNVKTQEILSHRDASVSEAITSLMNSFYKRDLSKDEKLNRITSRIEELSSEIAKHEKSLELIKERGIERLNRKYLKEIGPWLNHRRNIVKNLEEQVALIQEGKITDFGQGESDYYKEANKLCGSSDYYRRPNELFARAFEAWVFDEIQDRGGRSDYLVHSVDDGLYAGEEYKGNPYPSGDERKNINVNMRSVVDVVKAEVELSLENETAPRM